MVTHFEGLFLFSSKDKRLSKYSYCAGQKYFITCACQVFSSESEGFVKCKSEKKNYKFTRLTQYYIKTVFIYWFV